MKTICKGIISLLYANELDTITRYYKLQASSEAAPSKPTDGVYIPDGWSPIEPEYTAGSDDILYFVDQIKMSKGDIKYSEISKSSSYLAAKAAYELANSHETRIANAETNIESNATKIELKASQVEVTNLTDTMNAYIEKDTVFTQTIDGWRMDWTKILKTDEADVENHQDYITFQNGDIILGESKSDLKLKIANDSIQFKGTTETEITPDNDTTAWITGKQFNINRGEIHEYLRVGNLILMPKENGNFTIDII